MFQAAKRHCIVGLGVMMRRARVIQLGREIGPSLSADDECLKETCRFSLRRCRTGRCKLSVVARGPCAKSTSTCCRTCIQTAACAEWRDVFAHTPVRDRCPSTVSRSEVLLFAVRDRDDVCTNSPALCWWMFATDPRPGTNSNTAPELRSQPYRTCPNDEAGGTSRVRLDVVSFRSVTCNAKDHGWRTRAVKGSPFSSWLNWQQLSPSFRLP